MTPTDALCHRAAEVLDQLAEMLDPGHTARQIDEPIDRAAMEFDYSEGGALSHRQFLETVARFLRHLYAQAFPRGRQLSLSQARDEAVVLLEQGYQDAFSSGYDEALAEATDPSHPGLETVLLKVAELVGARQRQMYVRWVTARHIDPADWRMKCAVASLLLDRCRPWLPDRLQDCPPAQFADYIPDLLPLYLARPD